MTRKQLRELGKRLRAAREKKKLTIEDLSGIREVGVSVLAINRMEKGQPISYWAIRRVARYLNIGGGPQSNGMPVRKNRK